MPNWVKNNLRIKVNGEKVLEILEMIKDEKGNMTFNKVAQMPEELENEPSPQRDEEKAKKFKEKYGADDWYNWRCKNWGCKWDASESGFYEQDGYSMVTFHTPWSPPEKFIESLSKMFPKVEFELQFAEEGYGYAGKLTAKNGQVDNQIYMESDAEEIGSSIWDEEWVDNWEGE